MHAGRSGWRCSVARSVTQRSSCEYGPACAAGANSHTPRTPVLSSQPRWASRWITTCAGVSTPARSTSSASCSVVTVTGRSNSNSSTTAANARGIERDMSSTMLSVTDRNILGTTPRYRPPSPCQISFVTISYGSIRDAYDTVPATRPCPPASGRLRGLEDPHTGCRPRTTWTCSGIRTSTCSTVTSTSPTRSDKTRQTPSTGAFLSDVPVNDEAPGRDPGAT